MALILDEFWKLEHSKNGSTPPKNKGRSKRHIGVPDHGGFQRIIATAGLAPSLQEVSNKGPANSIDVVFTTYWQYPAKVRIILPEDKACIKHYRKLAKQGKYSPNANDHDPHLSTYIS